MKRALHIFYKDLNFHRALFELAKSHQILPVFLWSEYLNQGIDTSPSVDYRYTWAGVFNCNLLPQDINMPRVVDVESIIGLCKIYNIDTVSMLRHYEPREVKFQSELKELLEREGYALMLQDGYAMAPLGKEFWHLENNDFTLPAYRDMWYNKFCKKGSESTSIEWIAVNFGNEYLADRSKCHIKRDLAYLSRLQYDENESIDKIALYNLLSHGVISAQSLLDIKCSDDDSAYLLDALCQRDYAYERLYYYAGTARQLYGNVLDISWRDNALDYQNWCQGQTDNPRLNKVMQTLYDTGQMAEDDQKYAAAYLTKTLKVNWREGVRWYKEQLESYDLAQCIYLWQSILMVDDNIG